MHTTMAEQLKGRPSDLPPAEHYAHGSRARYVAGCRCDACRAANCAYYHERQRRAKEAAALIVTPKIPVEKLWTAPDGTCRTRRYRRACPGVNGNPCPTKSHLRKDSKGGVCSNCRLKLAWNGLVDASPAKEHLAALSMAGIGSRTVHNASGVARSVLRDVASGRKLRIRANTLRDILSVDVTAMADWALVPAAETHRRIREMRRAGYSKAELAVELGLATPVLQFNRRRVTVRTEHRVKKLHTSIMESLRRPSLCTQCGQFHDEMSRLEFLRKRLPAKFEDIVGAQPCFYSNDAGNRRLYRDLHKLKAESENAVWFLPRSWSY